MKRVLVVDDAATVRRYHHQVLTAAGFEVLEAVNGLEALEHAVEGGISLYLVDVNMPVMDGFAFIRQLRARTDVAQSPVVMISTESEGKDREAAMDAGANYYVVKPAKPEVLTALARLLTGGGAR